MKKIFTLIAVASLFVGATAKQLVCDLSALPASSENTTWDASTNTFAWTTTYYNSMEVFGAGDYSEYTTLNYNSEAGTTDHFRIIVKYKDETDKEVQQTYSPATIGNISLTWSDLNPSINPAKITTIRISGANDCTGSVKISKIALKAPSAGYDLEPQGYKNVDLTTNWPTVEMPFTFGQSVGKHMGSDADSPSPSVNVDGCDYVAINVTSTGGGNIRVFLWDDTANDGAGARKTVYFYPASRYDEINGRGLSTWEGAPGAGINSIGEYRASLCGCKKLLGIKWDWGCTDVVVSEVFAHKGFAVDEARTFSCDEILDFSEVDDLEAYIATSVNGNTLSMTKVTGAVPANTGLVLKQTSDKATITIPTASEATFDVTGNKLVATTSSTAVAAGKYVLAGKGDAMGWYKVVTAGDATLAAGKCYLDLGSEASETHFVMDFSEEEEGAANSIEQVEQINNGIFYTLQGAKVEAPHKGNIYIVNGKKVMY